MNNIFPNGVLTAYKREENLKELLTRADPYGVTNTSIDSNFGYKRCNATKCDSCDNFVLETDSIVSNATGKRFIIRKDSTCSSWYVVYCAFCKKCGSQGVGSTTVWKPRLSNYKSHIKKKVVSCRIVKHFCDTCVDPTNPVGHLQFIILDRLDNVEDLSPEKIDDLLLQKEIFWISDLITQHKGLNGTHDWNRIRRNDKYVLRTSLNN